MGDNARKHLLIISLVRVPARTYHSPQSPAVAPNLIRTPSCPMVDGLFKLLFHTLSCDSITEYSAILSLYGVWKLRCLPESSRRRGRGCSASQLKLQSGSSPHRQWKSG